MGVNRIIWILVTSMFLVSCASKQKSADEKKAELFLGAGTEQLINKNYTEALKNLLQAKALNPKNPDILNNLGLTYFLKQEHKLAYDSFIEALQIAPNHSDTKINLASFYFQKGDLNLAEKMYKEILKDLVYEKQARTYYNLGLIALKKSQKRTAYQYFSKSIKDDENYCPAYFQLGLLYYQHGKYQRAYEDFHRARLGVCVSNPAPHYYQALTLLKQKKYHQAKQKFEDIISRFPRDAHAVEAQTKLVELNNTENTYTDEYLSIEGLKTNNKSF